MKIEIDYSIKSSLQYYVSSGFIINTAINVFNKLLKNKMDLYPFLTHSCLLHNSGSFLCNPLGINQNNQIQLYHYPERPYSVLPSTANDMNI